jgi:hypothetical protein
LIVSPASNEGVEMYEGVSPEQALVESALGLLHTLVLDPKKAGYMQAVVVDQSAA